jgi:hypothetical protein
VEAERLGPGAVARELGAGRVERAQLANHRLVERGQRERVLDARGCPTRYRDADRVDLAAIEGEQAQRHVHRARLARVHDGGDRAPGLQPQRHRQRRQRAPDRVPRGLGDARDVDDGPTRRRPAVVHLPDQRAADRARAGALPTAAEVLVRVAHRLGLDELRRVDVLGERGHGTQVVGQVHGQPAMAVRRAGAGLVVPGQRAHRQRRVRLQPELADEARLHLVVALVGQHLLVPDLPAVAVARVLVAGQADAVGVRRVRAAGPVAAARVEFGADRGQQFFVQRAPVEGRRVGVGAAGAMAAERFGHRVVLVVAAPEREAGAVAQPAHGGLGLGAHAVAELRVGRVHAAGEHEVLPDQHAELVAGVVEGLVLVHAAAPDAQHVHVGVDGLDDALAQALRAHAIQQQVLGNPVGAAGEELAAIDLEAEAQARLAGHRGLHQPQRAQADAARVLRQRARAVDDARAQRVERLRAHADGPPQARLGHGQRGAGGRRRDAGRRDHPALGIEQFVLELKRGGSPRELGAQFQRRAAVGEVDLRAAVDVDDAGLPAMTADRAPRAAGQQHRTPVPAEVVLRLARMQPRAVAVPQRALAVLGLALAGAGERRVEAQQQLVGADAQQRARVHAPRHEHVVRLQQRLAVEPGGAPGVQAVEDQVLVRGQRGDLEAQPPRPGALAHPLHGGLVHRVERVGDAAGGQQRAVRGARYGGGYPRGVGQRGERGAVGAGRHVGELPAAAQVDHGIRMHGGQWMRRPAVSAPNR